MEVAVFLLLTGLVLAGGGVPQRFTIRGGWRAEVGETLTWDCYFFGRPATVPLPASYEWTKDKEVIPGETGVTLTFTSVTTQDVGIYQCGDPNSTVIRLDHELYVSGAMLPKPHIRYKHVAVSGRSFVLECIILEGYPHNDKTRYTWYKGGTEIEGQSGNSLQFTRVRETDAGEYTCTAREGPVETISPPSSPMYLTPLVSPQVRIKGTSPDGVIKGILGENLTLTCEVTKAFPWVPADGYSWSYLPSTQGQQRPLAGKTSTLTLGPLTREDGGQYFCQARNDQDFRELNLTGQASATIHIVYLQNITLTSDHEVDEGDPVTLACKVDSQPTAHLVWIVHGREVRHVTDNLDHYVIPSADCSDSTSYTCRASNTDLPGREMSASSSVRVRCKQGLPPTLVTVQAEVSAPFSFSLPSETSLVVVVHPSGQDILIVRQDCSFAISSAFLPRVLHPGCDPAHRHLSFTLTRVTEADEGSYVCRKGAIQGTLLPKCETELRIKRRPKDTPQPDIQFWVGFGVASAVYLIVFLLLILGFKFRSWRKSCQQRARTAGDRKATRAETRRMV